MTRSRPADWTWFMILANGGAYELIAIVIGEELLSAAALRYRIAHPILWRLFVIVVCGHLGGLLPHQVDIFSERNPLHLAIARVWPAWAVITDRIAAAKEGKTLTPPIGSPL